MNYQNVGVSTFQVRVNHVDTRYRLTVHSIADLLQEASINHADNAGFGYEHMRKAGVFWVLTRMKIEVHKLPKWKDTVKIETWVVNREKFFTRRDFQIRDENGDLLVSAASGWMLIDIESKRPQFVDNFPLEIEMYPNRLAVDTKLDKISEYFNLQYTHVFLIRYSDLDFMRHLNNTQYYKKILDTYQMDFREKNFVKSFEINYLAEVFFNDEIDINTEKIVPDKEYKHVMKRKKDKKIVCRAYVVWEKITEE